MPVSPDHPVALTGEHGLLTTLVTGILQRGLEVELVAHVGHRFRETRAGTFENSRNGAFGKHLRTDLGMVELRMPRDRAGTFEPVTVPKHDRRRVASTVEIAALYASGTTRSQMRSQLDRMNQFRMKPETTDALANDLEVAVLIWQHRRFETTYPVLLFDTILLGERADSNHLDVAVAVDAYGGAELLGIWRRRPRVRGSDRWMPIFAELKRRGLTDARSIFSSRDADMAEAANRTWLQSEVRSGVEGLVTNSLR